MKVAINRDCYYEGKYYNAGSVFKLKDEKHFSKRYMEVVDDEAVLDPPAKKLKGPKPIGPVAKSSGDVDVL